MSQRRIKAANNGTDAKCGASLGLFWGSVWSMTVYRVSKNDTDVAHYSFDADQPILIILAGNSYGVWAIIIISLFNFSYPFAITSLICCEITILYKPMAKSMRNGKFRPPTAPKPLDRFWWNSKFRTTSWRPPIKQSFICIRRCGWSQRIHSLPLSLKRQFRCSCFPR